uniref:Fe2OG dioxygenase domain-containing protein n=1 Tax=Bionectria ochroleuca TaxID=29856 RepID=A0A8H7NMC6_BIOOC
MASETLVAPPQTVPTTNLRLSSGNGPITLKILSTPLRDASPSEIPLIDIGPLFSSALEDRQSVARQIHAAATHNGFFYISNHNVPSSITDEAYKACLDFFRQDGEMKLRADSSQSTYFNGYKGPGSQRINPTEGVDVRETFSWTYDPRFDPAVDDPAAIPAHAAKYIRSEDFPWEATANMPQFKASIVRYFESCLLLARALTRAFALSLDLPENYFDEKVRYPDAAFAFNYYPPIENPVKVGPDQQVSIGSHTDFQLFTILWQDTVGGLQVLNRDGQWLRAAPISDTFVVNIGDYLQRITNDRYVSTVHRAQNWSGRERVSMPFFWGFGLHESCGVVESCIGSEGSKYEEIGCEEWVQKRVRDMLTVEDEVTKKA